MGWYRFHVDRYEADTMHLSCLEHGAYRQLIDHYMRTRVPIPDNDQAMANICGLGLQEWTAIAPNIRAFFQPRNGKLRLKLCDQELDREDRLARKRSESAQIAAEKRWRDIKPVDAARMPDACVDDATPMRLDATRAEQSRAEEAPARSATQPNSEKPSPLRAPDLKNLNGHGGGRGNGKFADEANRNAHAHAKSLPFMPGRDDGERWMWIQAAEDVKDPNHTKAVTAMLKASKRAGVGWISPEERARRMMQ